MKKENPQQRHEKTEGCNAKPQVGFYTFLGLITIALIAYFFLKQ